MRTVVTGASGLLGSNLVVELLRQGHTVRATRRANSRVAHLDGFAIDWCDADLADAGSLVNSVAVGYGFCTDFISSSDRARHELGDSPGPVDTAISDALRWLREHGALRETRATVRPA